MSHLRDALTHHDFRALDDLLANSDINQPTESISCGLIKPMEKYHSAEYVFYKYNIFKKNYVEVTYVDVTYQIRQITNENFIYWTPLQYAVAIQNVKTIEYLLLKGADVTKKDSLGRNALAIYKHLNFGITKSPIIDLLKSMDNGEEKSRLEWQSLFVKNVYTGRRGELSSVVEKLETHLNPIQTTRPNRPRLMSANNSDNASMEELKIQVKNLSKALAELKNERSEDSHNQNIFDLPRQNSKTNR